MKRIVTFFLKIFFVIILAGGICALGFFGWKKFTQVQIEKLHNTVSKTLIQSAELCLYKMKYTDVIAIKKQAALGLTKSYSIVKFSGIVRAGIQNIDDVSFTISNDRKAIRLTLPSAELLGNEIILQRVFDERQSIFVPITTQEIFDEIELAKEDSASEIISEGLLDDADKRAEEYITQLMKTLGFEKVIIDRL